MKSQVLQNQIKTHWNKVLSAAWPVVVTCIKGSIVTPLPDRTQLLAEHKDSPGEAMQCRLCALMNAVKAVINASTDVSDKISNNSLLPDKGQSEPSAVIVRK